MDLKRLGRRRKEKYSHSMGRLDAGLAPEIQEQRDGSFPPHPAPAAALIPPHPPSTCLEHPWLPVVG